VESKVWPFFSAKLATVPAIATSGFAICRKLGIINS
jgi:hypothetical protein